MKLGAANESEAAPPPSTKQELRSSAALFVAIVSLAAVHELGIRALDRLHVVERLLAPKGVDGLVLPVAAVLVLVLRLFLVFVAPGLLVAATVRVVRACVRSRSMPP